MVLAAVVITALALQLYLNARYAHLRAPETALGADGQVFSDAQRFLATGAGQLALQMSITEFARVGRPGELNPAAVVVQLQGGRLTGRLAGYGTVGEAGAPVVTPATIAITSHATDRSGLIGQIVLLCSYSLCWDRGATAGLVLGPEDQLPPPDPADTAGGHLLRYSAGVAVQDRLVMVFSNRTGCWQPLLAERLSSSQLRSH